ncbi:MAG: sigma 54-interacting transcriptional regulator [Deltaproteobacteria bacterium]|jgi:two-component system NtrC family response regulator|nr:sigma 54-interacting transcriptional regulator [Deltaproteobacteria bacterium]MCW8893374.1 sigma 54-interacting transcriptional regulator [Deltaproteobacteria bacterium]MCW9049140.1 sigma 54-interacting transcriptional regulator [Deltaproteobacteria bacterium]
MALENHKALLSANAIVAQLHETQLNINQLIERLNSLEIEVDLPGIDANNLELSFADGVLTLRKRHNATQAAVLVHIVAENIKTQIALALAERMAQTDNPVVLYGPVGTGKHLFARRIHLQSARSKQPFVWFSCGTLASDEQLYSAMKEAGAGTLYFDDLDEFSQQSQQLFHQMMVKPVQERPFRIVVATSLSPEELRKKKPSAADFLETLQGCYIELPALLERPEDVEPLAVYHLEKLCHEKGIAGKIISPEFLQMLRLYPWPGNVRELVNTLEQVLMTAHDKKTLFAKDLPNHIRIQTLKKSAGQKKGL